MHQWIHLSKCVLTFYRVCSSLFASKRSDYYKTCSTTCNLNQEFIVIIAASFSREKMCITFCLSSGLLQWQLQFKFCVKVFIHTKKANGWVTKLYLVLRASQVCIYELKPLSCEHGHPTCMC